MYIYQYTSWFSPLLDKMYSMEPLVCNDLLDIIHPEGCCSNPLEMDLCMTRVLQKGEVIDLQKASTSVRLRCPHGGGGGHKSILFAFS